MTSSAWVPIEPVLPSMQICFFIIILYIHDAFGQPGPDGPSLGIYLFYQFFVGGNEQRVARRGDDVKQGVDGTVIYVVDGAHLSAGGAVDELEAHYLAPTEAGLVAVREFPGEVDLGAGQAAGLLLGAMPPATEDLLLGRTTPCDYSDSVSADGSRQGGGPLGWFRRKQS